MMHGREHGAEQDRQQHGREQPAAGRRRERQPERGRDREQNHRQRGKIHDDFGIGPCALMLISSKSRDRDAANHSIRQPLAAPMNCRAVAVAP